MPVTKPQAKDRSTVYETPCFKFQEKSGKNEVEWAEKAEIKGSEMPGSRRSLQSYILTYSGLNVGEWVGQLVNGFYCLVNRVGSLQDEGTLISASVTTHNRLTQTEPLSSLQKIGNGSVLLLFIAG